MPSDKQYFRAGICLVALAALAGCGREAMPRDSIDADAVELDMTAVPDRAPIETASLGSNVFESICRLGNPFAITGWDLDPQTRFLHFAGPFAGAQDGATHPYLYMSIPAPDRATVSTTVYLDELDATELRKRGKPEELHRFRLPHVTGLSGHVQDIIRELGEPARSRELDSGRTRLVFARELCLDGRRLVGVHVDVDDGRVVSAKGISHPDRLRWLVSNGRPPQPDATPTYYQDWKPREKTAQEAALTLMFLLESGDLHAAREKLWQPDEPPHALENLASAFAGGATIDGGTLTYQTLRYELDLADVAVACKLSDGKTFRRTFELRESADERWLVNDWRDDATS